MKRIRQRPEVVGFLFVCTIAGSLASIGPITSASATAKINYVAMGDSYSSGEGLAAQASGYITNLGYNTGKDGCHRANDAYPEHIKTSLGANLGSFTFVACSGDYTGAQIYTGTAASAVSSFDKGGSMLSGRDGESSQISTKYLNSSVNEITLTIGGNDAGFAKVAASCTSIMLKTGPVETVTGIPPIITGDSCASRLASSRAVIGNGTSSSELASALASTYEAILNDATSARLAVLTYPQLLTPTQIPKSKFCPLTGGTLIPRTATTAYMGFNSNVQGDVNAMEEGVNNDINSAVAAVAAIGSYQGRIRAVDATAPTAPFAQPCNTKTMSNSDINGIHFAPGDGIVQLLRCLPPRHNVGHSCDNFLATETLHPTALGHDRMAIAAEDAFKEDWQPATTPQLTLSDPQGNPTAGNNTYDVTLTVPSGDPAPTEGVTITDDDGNTCTTGTLNSSDGVNYTNNCPIDGEVAGTGVTATYDADGGDINYGLLTSNFLTVDPATSTGPLSTVKSVQIDGGYVAAGVGLRNLGYGTIQISGIPSGSTTYGAYLLWDILGESQTSAMSTPSFDGTPITGTFIGTGGTPCWSGTAANYAYEANITSLVSGNGDYAISGFDSGTTDGQDPWTVGSPPSDAEGASLIVFYQNPSSPLTTLQLYDGSTEVDPNTGGSLFQTLSGFNAGTDPLASTTFIVADGQGEDSNGGSASFDGTTLPNSAFLGSDPLAVPSYSDGNLWDTETFDVSTMVSQGDTSETSSVTGGGNDCVVWVGEVFSLSP